MPESRETNVLRYGAVGTAPSGGIIFIANASTGEAPKLLEELAYSDNALIEDVRLHKGLGGAGGFCAGIKRRHQAAYDRLWVMDDDAEPVPSELELLCRSQAMDSPETADVARKKFGKDARIQAHHRARSNRRRGLIPVPVDERAEERAPIDHSRCNNRNGFAPAGVLYLVRRDRVLSTYGAARRDLANEQ